MMSALLRPFTPTVRHSTTPQRGRPEPIPGLLRIVAQRLREAVGLRLGVRSVRARCNPGQRAERDRLVGGARPIGPDLLDRYAASAGNNGAHDRTAETALTRPHAATYKGLDLVRPLCAHT